ncbi:glycosyltransferase [Flavobacterium ardleyense]|uniref:glycosyltransferase n=1 Tax=Flavobacterium ardleyense TaxID=2038737 RepID=UPI00298C589B|nr:glycosyltransferase [Flavobacterium ardleyense]
MHILKIIHGYPPNYNAGSEVYSQSICNELSKKHKVSIFTREENPYAKDFEIRSESINENLDIYYVNNPHGKDGYKHLELDKNFAALIREIKPHVAHIGHLNHLSTGIIDELNKLNIPIIFTLHDFWLMCPRGQFLTRSIGKENNFQLCSGQEDKKCATNCYEVYFSGKEEDLETDTDNWKNWIQNRMNETRNIVDKVALFIAPSNYLRDRFIKDFKIPEDKITYLDYGFPVEYLTQTEKSVEITNYTFGYIGTHIPSKGINLLIEAFSKIEAAATLKIFGRANGQSTNALKQLAEISINPIEFHGEYINQNLANEVFSNVDCIVVPSIWAENSPLVIHEAQSCKIPVITADFGGMKEYVMHKENGLLFEHRNANSLQEQLEFAINNEEAMKQFGDKGYLYTPEGNIPDIQNHCEELERIYNKYDYSKNLWRLTIDTNPEDCNLKCIMCEEHSPYSNFIPNLFKETGVKRRRMKFETVERIFEQAKKLGVSEIIPSTMGEPLLYKEFDKLFELSKRHNIKINLTTNGTFPKKTVLEWAKLIVPNTTDIKISWNGATRETAEEIMIGVDFDKTILNIQEFIAYRNLYFQETGYFCRVTLQLTFMQNNMHELADIIKLAAKLGVDRVKGHQLWTHFEEIESLSMKSSQNGISKWNQYVIEAYLAQEEYRKPNGEKVILENIIALQENEKQAVPYEYECPFLTKELWISATGKISPCCAPDNLRKELGDFGNIEEFSVEEVLNSTIYKDLVANYKSKPLCQTCNMRKPV